VADRSASRFAIVSVILLERIPPGTGRRLCNEGYCSFKMVMLQGGKVTLTGALTVPSDWATGAVHTPF
jgi:hypothetical protein